MATNPFQYARIYDTIPDHIDCASAVRHYTISMDGVDDNSMDSFVIIDRCTVKTDSRQVTVGSLQNINAGAYEINVSVPANAAEEQFSIWIEDDGGNNLMWVYQGDCGNHSYGAWIQNAAPTCTTTGSEVSTCTRCGSTKSRVVAAIGHHLITDPAVPATCTTSGLSAGQHCNRAGCNYVATPQLATPPLGHSYGEWTRVTDPTCMAEGQDKRTCSRCGATETRSVAATGHTAASGLSGYVAPTHTQPGYSGDVICKTCGTIITKGTTIQASGHVMGEWSPDGDQHVRVCADGPECNIEREDHTFTDWETVIAPTCTTDGEQRQNCTVCGYTQVQTLPAIGHEYAAPEIEFPASRRSLGVVGCSCIHCQQQIETKFTKLKRKKPLSKSY